MAAMPTTDVGIEGGVREAMPMERRVALLPKECQGHKLKVIDLPDPSTGKARAFAFFDGGEGGAQEAQVLEATWYKTKNSSWFVQEVVALFSSVTNNPSYFNTSVIKA